MNGDPQNPLGEAGAANPRDYDVGAQGGGTPPPAPPQQGGAPSAAPQAPASPAAAMTSAMHSADIQHHSILGKAFSSLMGNDTSYQIDPQTGKLVQTTVPQKPGQLWRGIIASAILGGATAAKEKAPGFIQGAAEGGAAVMDKAQQQDLIKRQQAQQQFEDQLKAKRENTDEDLKRAQIAFHNAQTLHENRIMQHQDYLFHKEIADSGKKELQPYIDADPTLVKFKDVGETEMNDLLKNNSDAAHYLWEPTGTRVIIGANGKPDVEATYSGVDPKGNVKVTDDQIKRWKDSGIDQIYGKATWDVLKSGKELPATTYMAITQKSQELTNKNLADKKIKLDAEKEEAAIKLAKSQANHFNAEASKLYSDEADKKAAIEAFDMLSSGKDISKLSIKGRQALVKGLTDIIKTNVDEIKALPKDPATGQIQDQDRARDLYGNTENYQKIIDRLYGVKPAAGPTASSSGGGNLPSLDERGKQYIKAALSDNEGKPILASDKAGDVIWSDSRLSSTQKLAVTKQYGAVIPWDAVEQFSKKAGITSEVGAEQLKAAGLKVAEKPAPESGPDLSLQD